METDWEQRYQSGETPWEKGAPHPALVEFLRRLPMRGRVLVPGCGLGHDVRAIAASADEVVGLDLAPSAVAAARQHPEVGGENFVEGDLFNLPRPWAGAFDWVFEHTCFCAIDPARRADYVDAVAGVLKPGGRLLAVFYLQPDMDPGEAGPPFGVAPAELDALFGHAFEVEAEWTPDSTYPGRENREVCRLLRRK